MLGDQLPRWSPAEEVGYRDAFGETATWTDGAFLK
jgi:hypothetical protein